ncbi:MAG: tetratricopeptide repeat protein [Thermoplasmata archaeon]
MAEFSIVGRHKELAFLRERLKAITGGNGTAVLVKGDTGTGKTRLCREILHIASEIGFSASAGWCISNSAQPLIPFEDALKGIGLQHLIEESKPPRIESIHLFIKNELFWSIERERIRAEEVGYEKVRNFALKEREKFKDKRESRVLIARYGNYEGLHLEQEDVSVSIIVYGRVRETLIRDAQEILRKTLAEGNIELLKSDFSGLIRSGKYDGIDWAQGMHDVKKLNLFENVFLGLKRYAERQPVVLFIDDLQLGDTATIELFLYLSRNIKGARILLLGTLNTEEGIMPQNWKELLHQIELEQNVEIITLENLSPAEVKEIFSAATGLTISEELGKHIYEITGGNPLFIIEYLYYITGNYTLRTEEDLIRILKAGGLPETLSRLVHTRFEKLSKNEKELCIALAVMKAGDTELLSKVLSQDGEKILKTISGLKEKGILTSQGDTWKFLNSTFAEAIYATLSNTRKLFLHKKVLENLLEFHGQDERLFGEILRHGRVLNNKEVILEYGIKAGDTAMARYSVGEAIENYRAAMEVATEEKQRELLPKVLDALDIVSKYEACIELIDGRIKNAGDAERVALLRRKAEILIKKGEYSDGMVCVREALQTHQKKGGDDVELAKIYSVIGILQEKKGDYREAMQWEGKALKILERLEGVESTLSFVYNRLGVVCWHMGDYKTSELYYHKSLEIAKKTNDMVALSRCYNNLGVLYRSKGELERALAFYLKSLEIDERLGDRWGIAGTCNNIGIVYHEMGNIPASLQYYNKALEIEREVGDLWGIALLHNNLGIGYFEMGEFEKALEHYEHSLKIYERVGDSKGAAIVYNNIGDVQSARGEIESARASYEKSAEVCRKIWAIDALFNPIHGLTEISLSPSAIPFCEQRVCELEEIARKLSDRKKIAIATLMRGRLEAVKGNFEGARMLFQEAEKNFEESKELIDLAKARYHYGVFEMKAGEKESARKLLEIAKTMFTNFKMENWRKRTELALRMLESETIWK